MVAEKQEIADNQEKEGTIYVKINSSGFLDINLIIFSYSSERRNKRRIDDKKNTLKKKSTIHIFDHLFTKIHGHLFIIVVV